MDTAQESLKLHTQLKGKLRVIPTQALSKPSDLALQYTPGVAAPCREIHQDREKVYQYTGKGNLVAVVTDGSAVLGLGNIGPEAGLPVMEGKALLFKEFGNVDAVPICLDTQDPLAIIQAVKWLAPGFGGINLEDIAAPRCFEVEEALKRELDIPVFHDDQHGTAIVVLAGLINALKITHRKPETTKVVINGAGSAGTAIAKILLGYGFKNLVVCDRHGALHRDDVTLNPAMRELAYQTNPSNFSGDLKAALQGSDVFIGVSAPKLLTSQDIATMNRDGIVFAMANPDPEIMPAEALAGGAKIVATGRSDFPNQVNNVLAFPGIFRGALDVRARGISEAMKLEAALAISSLVTEQERSEGQIIPRAFHPDLAFKVAKACAMNAMVSGNARISMTEDELDKILAQNLLPVKEKFEKFPR